MIADVDEGFLTTETWKTVKKKIRLKSGIHARKIFPSLPGIPGIYVTIYTKIYHASTAMKVEEQAMISRIVVILSFFSIAAQSRFCFFAANPIRSPVPVPASTPRAMIIRISSRVAVMQKL
jgi:hypothetical protein